MKNPVLAILVLSLGAGSMSCSTHESNGNGGGGTQAESSSQGGSASGGSQNASGGASSSTASGGSSGAAGSTANSSGEDKGGSSAVAGQSASGGKAGAGGGKSGGNGGNAGATSSGGQSTSSSADSGGSTETGGTTAAGGQATGGRSTGPRTGGSSGGASSGVTGGTGGGSAGGGSTGTDTGPKGGAASSPGCGKTPTLTNGAHKIGNRNFMMRIPANYDNTHPYPMVFAFHWQGGTMNDVDGGGTSGYTWSYYGLRELADKSTDHKMIFVAPDGNGGWPNSGGQDLKFVDDIYKQLTEDLCVDTTRVFSMGFSYGGGMTYEIACARAKTFRAAAVYAGAQLSGCDGGKDPIAYIGFHSVSDPKCGYSGGEGLRDTFVSNNGCTKQTPPKPSGMTHVCTKYAGCKAGYPVEWCAFDGAGHSPAPVDGQSSDSGGGDKTWTKAEAWAFFTQF